MRTYNSLKRRSYGASRAYARAFLFFFSAFLVLSFSASFSSAEYIADLQIHHGNPNILWDTQSYTIQQVIDEGGYIVGDKLFRYFDVTPSGTFTSMGPDASEITVTAVKINGDYGLKFNGLWMAAGGEKCDSTIQFQAVILPEFVDEGYRFHDNWLWMTAPGESGTTDGKVSISEVLYDGDPSDPNSNPIKFKYVYYNNENDNSLDDYETFDPRTELWVVKDVGVDGGTEAGSISVSEFYQTFSQIPEPSTLALLAFGSIGLFAYARRKRR
ncbi:MAG: PEP-CTERM sorting domain-containing protein [Pirellulales bacterium]|nr:PEP-CTERM sorting domain-containing protein [Pirellulales bacterium]